MKKLYALATTLMIGSLGFSQFSDDFESYTAGEYLGPQSNDWTTWSGTEGGADDVLVATGESASGSNALHFVGTGANGGPADVVLPFGGEYSSGTFNYKMKMLVISGAYFNFQSNSNVGVDWAIDVRMEGDGSMSVTDDGAGVTYFNSTFPLDEWFEIELDINLTNNNWRILINGQEKGAWANNSNQIALLDLFPINGHNFWVDDVSFTYEEFQLPANNGAIFNISPISGIQTQERHVTTDFRNLGSNEITSFEVKATYEGNTVTKAVSGVSLQSYDIISVDFDDPIVLGNAGDLQVSVSKVNGVTGDDDASDDSKSIALNPVIPAEGKMVVGEEATGTWCGWCPRGMVAMEMLAEEYHDFFIGIAVHNNDPMADADYDEWVGTRISGYPSGFVNRGATQDPSEMPESFLGQITQDASSAVVQSATYNPDKNELTVTVDVEMTENGSGTWKVAVVLTEDGLRGTGAGWAQVNYYSHEDEDIPLVGAGLDWQAEPTPVPASKMVYNDVARMISNPEGDTLAYRPQSGESFQKSFTMTLDPSWNVDNMDIIAMTLNHRRQIDNATRMPASEAKIVGVSEWEKSLAMFTVYPNPANNQAYLNLNLESSANVNVRLLNQLGKRVWEQNFGEQVGNLYYPINVSDLQAGIYLVELEVAGNKSVKKLIIE